ncbi:MAG: DUF4834 domain-containing protein [Bacteroidota bacterium]
MIKFIIYLFLFYFLFRFVFGVLLKGIFRATVINLNQNKQEGRNGDSKVKVETNTEKNPNASDKNIGEYVDYEEVK